MLITKGGCMTDNLIKFPKDSFALFPSNQEESIDHIRSVRQEYCDEVVGDITEAIFSVLHSYGFILKSDHHHVKDIIFMEEATKAMVYRYKKLDHSLHDLIETSVTLPDETEEEQSKETVEQIK